MAKARVCSKCELTTHSTERILSLNAAFQPNAHAANTLAFPLYAASIFIHRRRRRRQLDHNNCNHTATTSTTAITTPTTTTTATTPSRTRTTTTTTFRHSDGPTLYSHAKPTQAAVMLLQVCRNERAQPGRCAYHLAWQWQAFLLIIWHACVQE